MLLALIVLLLPTPPVAAQPPAPPQWPSLEKALGKEDYAEARKLADAIAQRGTPDDRAKAAAVYARILLGLGQTDQARQYLAMQTKQGFAPQHAAIYAAWLVAADGKPDEAAAALEKILQQAGESPDEAVAEAADVLAMLHMARGDREKAKKAVEFGIKVLQYHGTKDGYVLALLRGRLAVDPDEAYPEAKKLYEQAEKLRREGKAAEAGRLFTSVCVKYPLSTWNDAAGYRIGQCLETLGRTAQAEQHWTTFVAGSPAGPWRGQARVGLVHLALVARGDLKTASQQAAAAHKILTAGVDEPAAATWNHAAVEIHLCQGIVALLEARHDTATAALAEAKDQAVSQMEDPSGRFLAGLHRLSEAAERREEVIPAQLAVPDERLRLALSLGTIYNLLGRFEQAAGAFDHVLRGPVRIALQPHRSFAALGKARALVGLNVAGTLPMPSASNDEETRVPEPLPPASVAGVWSVGATGADGTTERACYFGSLDQTSYAIYLRAGLVAYLSERSEEAVECFEQAKPFEPERSFVVVHGEIPTGIERLIAAARTGKSLTPEEARRGDDKARLILMLADVYHEGEQWEKSLELCSRVIDNAAPKATREQRSYAFFRRGRNFYCLEDEGYDPEAAFNEYTAAARMAPKAPWADRAMFLAANVQWNDHQDANRAVELWRRLVDLYPNSEDADRSAYYIGVAYMWSERPEEAERALLEFVEKRPASRFATQARQHLAELERQKHGSERPAARKTPGRR